MKLKGKKTLVVGLGKTGEAVCRFLQEAGADLLISEKRQPEEIGPAYQEWKKRAQQMETGGHTLDLFLKADLIVTSPGVPPLPEFRAARRHGIPVIAEIELAFPYLKGTIIGITGSNGKSTTTTLIHAILRNGGLNAFLAGNIGAPLIEFTKQSQAGDIYVTELSSFQLENIHRFRASTAVFLNMSPDHLDWHENFENYYNAKKKLISGQKSGDQAVLNRDDPYVWALKAGTVAEVFSFSRKHKVRPGVYIKGGWIVFSDAQEERLMETSAIPLLGMHNLENVMASALVGRLLGVPISRIRQSILAFKGLEHRLRFVTSFKGITFYNDSKATNVDACLKAIRSFETKIILILGGKDKKGDFEKLRGDISGSVKAVILLGEAKKKIRKVLKDAAPMKDASSMAEAVGQAFAAAEAGEVVLLAPACTSWDMYDNFEQRGEDFKRCVYALQKSHEDEG